MHACKLAPPAHLLSQVGHSVAELARKQLPSTVCDANQASSLHVGGWWPAGTTHSCAVHAALFPCTSRCTLQVTGHSIKCMTCCHVCPNDTRQSPSRQCSAPHHEVLHQQLAAAKRFAVWHSSAVQQRWAQRTIVIPRSPMQPAGMRPHTRSPPRGLPSPGALLAGTTA